MSTNPVPPNPKNVFGPTADGPAGAASPDGHHVGDYYLDDATGQLWMVRAPAPGYVRTWVLVNGPAVYQGAKERFLDTAVGDDTWDGLVPVHVAGTRQGPVKTYQRVIDFFSEEEGGLSTTGPNRVTLVNEGTSSEALVSVRVPVTTNFPLVLNCGFRDATFANAGGAIGATLSVPGSAFGFAIAGASPIATDGLLVGQAVLVTRSDGATFHKRVAKTLSGPKEVYLLTNIPLSGGQTLTAYQFLEPRGTLRVGVLDAQSTGQEPNKLGQYQMACYGCKIVLDPALAASLPGSPPPQILWRGGFGMGCSGCEYDLNGAEALGGGMLFLDASAMICRPLATDAPDLERPAEGTFGGWFHSAGRSFFNAVVLEAHSLLRGFFVFTEMGVVRTRARAELHLIACSAQNVGAFFCDAGASNVLESNAGLGLVTRFRSSVPGGFGIAFWQQSGLLQIQNGEVNFDQVAADVGGLFVGPAASLDVDALSFLTGSGGDSGLQIASNGRVTIHTVDPVADGYTLTGTTFEIFLGRAFGANPTTATTTWAAVAAAGADLGFKTSTDGALITCTDF